MSPTIRFSITALRRPRVPPARLSIGGMVSTTPANLEIESCPKIFQGDLKFPLNAAFLHNGF